MVELVELAQLVGVARSTELISSYPLIARLGRPISADDNRSPSKDGSPGKKASQYHAI